MPTTDQNDKYDEEQRRLEAEQARQWDTILSCGAWVVAAIIVWALIVVLMR